MRYWEDFAAGSVLRLSDYEMTREEIVDFGRRWDPQVFHVDEEAAAASSFGSLVASGWHTVCALMRLYVDEVLLDSASMGSPGLEDIRWLAPVRPGDVLQATVEVVETRPSATRADRGTVIMRWEAKVAGTVVFRMTGRGLFGRRPLTAAAASGSVDAAPA